MLEDVTVSLITERRVSRPWGLAGGGPGAPGENWLPPQGNQSRAERLLDTNARSDCAPARSSASSPRVGMGGVFSAADHVAPRPVPGI